MSWWRRLRNGALRNGAPRDGPPRDGRPRRGERATDSLAEARERMVQRQIEARGLRDPELLRAFRAVPRELFVDSSYPYGDNALPIEAGQTISQPFVVAFMTDAAQPRRPDGWHGARVLDVGTGSGYQAAILAELGARVTSIERHAELSRSAAEALLRAGYPDVRLVVGDGTRGCADDAPYDAIIVGAASPSVPMPLLEQLATEGGRLVIPIGAREHQRLTVVKRHGDEYAQRERDAVVFVPLVGEHGFQD